MSLLVCTAGMHGRLNTQWVFMGKNAVYCRILLYSHAKCSDSSRCYSYSSCYVSIADLTLALG